LTNSSNRAQESPPPSSKSLPSPPLPPPNKRNSLGPKPFPNRHAPSAKPSQPGAASSPRNNWLRLSPAPASNASRNFCKRSSRSDRLEKSARDAILHKATTGAQWEALSKEDEAVTMAR